MIIAKIFKKLVIKTLVVVINTRYQLFYEHNNFFVYRKNFKSIKKTKIAIKES